MLPPPLTYRSRPVQDHDRVRKKRNQIEILAASSIQVNKLVRNNNNKRHSGGM